MENAVTASNQVEDVYRFHKLNKSNIGATSKKLLAAKARICRVL